MSRSAATLGAWAFAVACGLAAPPAGAAPAVHTVVIDKMRFGPAPSGLKAGDVIVWVNKDIFRHTASARDGSFDVDLAAGETGRATLRKAGALQVYCRHHPGMSVRLSVSP